jgi:hypothetical protein
MDEQPESAGLYFGNFKPLMGLGYKQQLMRISIHYPAME